MSDGTITEEIITAIRSALVDSVNNIIQYIPQLIIGLVIVLIGWIIARIVRFLLTRFLGGVKFDDVVKGLGFAEGLERIKQTPTAIVGSVVFWTLFLNFLLFALEAVQLGRALKPLRDLINSIPLFIAATTIMIIGIVIARFVGKIISTGLESAGMTDINGTIGNLVQYVIMIMVGIVAVQLIGLDVGVMTDLLLALVIVLTAGIALAFGLGGRDITRNILAGYYAREMFKVGDRVLVDGANDEEGVITGIGTINVEVETVDGRIIIPNTHLTQSAIRTKN